MPPPQLIIDFNRRLQPSPFNTGPSIPSKDQAVPSSSEIHCPFPRRGALALRREDVDLPELSYSPASTISSATSLGLEDDEIRNIFSLIRNDIIHGKSRKEVLNPRAAPFVPSFAMLGNESPAITTVHGTECPYERPPGLPHPPPKQKLPSGPKASSHKTPNSQQSTPAYLSFLDAAFEPSIQHQDREILVKRIVTSLNTWDVENLLGLSETICYIGCNPGPDFIGGKVVATCCPTRYFSAHENQQAIRAHCASQEQAFKSIALVAAELHRQFSSLKGAEVGQAFAWNIREVSLMQFIHCWDATKSTSITYENKPSLRSVRSALLLCKVVPALFKAGLIGRDHISMCISILLKDLISVEHAEAVCSIVMGCGQAFWAADSGTETKRLPSIDRTLRINRHVREFVTGLHANFTQRNLHDRMSITDQPWCDGKVHQCLGEIVDNVRRWEAASLAELGS